MWVCPQMTTCLSPLQLLNLSSDLFLACALSSLDQGVRGGGAWSALCSPVLASHASCLLVHCAKLLTVFVHIMEGKDPDVHAPRVRLEDCHLVGFLELHHPHLILTSSSPHPLLVFTLISCSPSSRAHLISCSPHLVLTLISCSPILLPIPSRGCFLAAKQWKT